MNPSLEFSKVASKILSFLKVPRVTSQKVLTIMLVYRLQDLVDRGVPRLSVRRVPLAGHAASQLRILELRVTAALSVLDPD